MSFWAENFLYTEHPTTWAGKFGKFVRRVWLVVLTRFGLLPVAPLQPVQQTTWRGDLAAALQRSAAQETATTVMDERFMAERLERVAADSIARHPGDLVEIGCFQGQTSRVLAGLAHRHGRRFIAVDPWQDSQGAADGGAYACFLENIKPYADCVDIVRRSSLDPVTQELLRQRPLAFAYVDGLHTYYAALADIRSVGHCAGTIAVDDISYGVQIMLAMQRAARELDRLAVHVAPCKEGYILHEHPAVPQVTV